MGHACPEEKKINLAQGAGNLNLDTLTMSMSASQIPSLVLGTAMWGWTVPEARAFAILDRYYERGFRQVDSATNYPLNGQVRDFRASEQILSRWIEKNGVQDLQITMKVGSITNIRIPDHNLRPAFLHLQKQYYRQLFGPNLHTLMIHWDNRDDENAVRESLEALAQIQSEGLAVGLSGVKHPKIHAPLAKKLGLVPAIQIKHNLSYSDYPRYAHFHGQKCFYTYGINAGGWKAAPDRYRQDSSLAVRGGDTQETPRILLELQAALRQEGWEGDLRDASFLNRLAMIFAFCTPDVAGVLIGPGSPDQLTGSLDFYVDFSREDYRKLFSRMLNLHRQYAPTDRHI